MTNLVVEMQEMLDEYVAQVDKAAKDAAKEAAELTAKTLKQTSPKRKVGKGKGKYANGWTVKKVTQGPLLSYVVYNSRMPGLTHVLENGHVAKNQYGTFGRVRAIKHIGPAAEAGIQRFELSLRTRINRGL